MYTPIIIINKCALFHRHSRTFFLARRALCSSLILLKGSREFRRTFKRLKLKGANKFGIYLEHFSNVISTSIHIFPVQGIILKYT